jgi:hypothetical protein
MAGAARAPHIRGMTSRFFFLLVVFAAFTAYSATVVVSHGYTGFLVLAWREPWAGQMLLDLTIALSLFLSWAIRDGRARGIPTWPFVLATILLGSIGALAYLVARELKRPSATVGQGGQAGWPRSTM